MKYTLDATNKKPGRLASEIASVLMGKNRTDYTRNRIPEVEIEVTNAKAMSIESKKAEDKRYYRHSGYPGTLRSRTMAQVVAKSGAREVLRIAVSGMLPKNKLRPRMLKNLKITN